MTAETEQIVKKAIELAEKTGNFVIEQTPLLVQEFYRWHIAINVFCIITGIAIIFFGFLSPLFFTHNRKEHYYDRYLWRYCTDNTPHYMVLTFSLLVGFVFIISGVYELMFIMTAPKIYLIEYFTKN